MRQIPVPMLETFAQASALLLALDPSVAGIAALSLRVSLAATAIGCAVGIPAGAFLAIARFPGRGGAIVALNALMGLPAVVVGLVIYLALSRSGPLGHLGLLFTPAAMVVAQAVLVTPLVAALTRQIVEDAEGELGEQLRSLGLPAWRCVRALLLDVRFSLAVAVFAAFGRAIAEVGAVLVVGGNIAGHTRTMTTAISLETQKGDLPLALALGMVLLALVLVVNAAAAVLRAHALRRHG